MTDPIAIRSALPADLPGVAAGYEWLFAPPGQRPPRWDEAAAVRVLHRVAGDDRSAVLVADAGGSVVGFCTVYLDIESVRYGQRAWIEDLAVHPDWRSKGVGRQLLAAATGWARLGGATHIELDSGDKRADAHRFYDSLRPSMRSRCFSWTL